MADFIESRLEETIDELSDAQLRGLLSPDEVKKIVTRRRNFEYEILKQTSTVFDFLEYIKYEAGLHLLKGARFAAFNRQRDKKTVKKTISNDKWRESRHTHTFLHLRRISDIFNRAVRKFPLDKRLWLQYLDFCLMIGATNVVLKVILRALRTLGGNQSELWVLASDRLLQTGDVKTARSLLRRGLQISEGKSLILWKNLLKLEAIIVFRIHQDKLAAEAKAALNGEAAGSSVGSGKNYEHSGASAELGGVEEPLPKSCSSELRNEPLFDVQSGNRNVENDVGSCGSKGVFGKDSFVEDDALLDEEVDSELRFETESQCADDREAEAQDCKGKKAEESNKFVDLAEEEEGKKAISVDMRLLLLKVVFKQGMKTLSSASKASSSKFLAYAVLILQHLVFSKTIPAESEFVGMVENAMLELKDQECLFTLFLWKINLLKPFFKKNTSPFALFTALSSVSHDGYGVYGEKGSSEKRVPSEAADNLASSSYKSTEVMLPNHLSDETLDKSRKTMEIESGLPVIKSAAFAHDLISQPLLLIFEQSLHSARSAVLFSLLVDSLGALEAALCLDSKETRIFDQTADESTDAVVEFVIDRCNANDSNALKGSRSKGDSTQNNGVGSIASAFKLDKNAVGDFSSAHVSCEDSGESNKTIGGWNAKGHSVADFIERLFSSLDYSQAPFWETHADQSQNLEEVDKGKANFNRPMEEDLFEIDTCGKYNEVNKANSPAGYRNPHVFLITEHDGKPYAPGRLLQDHRIIDSCLQNVLKKEDLLLICDANEASSVNLCNLRFWCFLRVWETVRGFMGEDDARTPRNMQDQFDDSLISPLLESQRRMLWKMMQHISIPVARILSLEKEMQPCTAEARASAKLCSLNSSLPNSKLHQGKSFSQKTSPSPEIVGMDLTVRSNEHLHQSLLLAPPANKGARSIEAGRNALVSRIWKQVSLLGSHEALHNLNGLDSAALADDVASTDDSASAHTSAIPHTSPNPPDVATTPPHSASTPPDIAAASPTSVTLPNSATPHTSSTPPPTSTTPPNSASYSSMLCAIFADTVLDSFTHDVASLFDESNPTISSSSPNEQNPARSSISHLTLALTEASSSRHTVPSMVVMPSLEENTREAMKSLPVFNLEPPSSAFINSALRPMGNTSISDYECGNSSSSLDSSFVSSSILPTFHISDFLLCLAKVYVVKSLLRWKTHSNEAACKGSSHLLSAEISVVYSALLAAMRSAFSFSGPSTFKKRNSSDRATFSESSAASLRVSWEACDILKFLLKRFAAFEDDPAAILSSEKHHFFHFSPRDKHHFAHCLPSIHVLCKLFVFYLDLSVNSSSSYSVSLDKKLEDFDWFVETLLLLMRILLFTKFKPTAGEMKNRGSNQPSNISLPSAGALASSARFVTLLWRKLCTLWLRAMKTLSHAHSRISPANLFLSSRCSTHLKQVFFLLSKAYPMYVNPQHISSLFADVQNWEDDAKRFKEESRTSYAIKSYVNRKNEPNDRNSEESDYSSLISGAAVNGNQSSLLIMIERFFVVPLRAVLGILCAELSYSNEFLPRDIQEMIYTYLLTLQEIEVICGAPSSDTAFSSLVPTLQNVQNKISDSGIAKFSDEFVNLSLQANSSQLLSAKASQKRSFADFSMKSYRTDSLWLKEALSLKEFSITWQNLFVGVRHDFRLLLRVTALLFASVTLRITTARCISAFQKNPFPSGKYGKSKQGAVDIRPHQNISSHLAIRGDNALVVASVDANNETVTKFLKILEDVVYLVSGNRQSLPDDITSLEIILWKSWVSAVREIESIDILHASLSTKSTWMSSARIIRKCSEFGINSAEILL